MESKQVKSKTESKKIHSEYISMLRKFEKTTQYATIKSRKNSGKNACQSLWWTSLLFTRAIILSKSILTLCPKSIYNPNGISWDFTSIATITRSLSELSIQFYYICTEDISEEEWNLRLKIMQLYDNDSRDQMFMNINSQDHDADYYKNNMNELIIEITSNNFYKSLSKELQNQCIKEKKTLFGYQNRNTILAKMCASTDSLSKFHGLYKFLSSNAHSSPLSYYRMVEQGRTGLENNIDKGYITHIALDFANSILEDITKGFEQLFNNATLQNNLLCRCWSS